MSWTVADVLRVTGGRIVNGLSADTRFAGAAELESARSGDVAFFFNKAYQKALLTSAPSVLVTGEPFVAPLEQAGLPIWKSAVVVACADPYRAMAQVSRLLAPKLSTVAHLDRPAKTEIHPTAVIDPTAEIGRSVRIGAHTVIEASVKVGDGTVIYPQCYLGVGTQIGEDTVLFPRVVAYEGTRIGSRVRLHAGVILGSDGFGFAPIKQDGRVVGHDKIFHLGHVEISDDVEIGAGATLDRSTFSVTRVGKGARLDHLVHLGHNTEVQEGGVVCGGTGIAGSSSVGKFAYVLGMVGLANNVHVGDGATVAAMSCVSKDIEPGTIAAGNPIRDSREFFKIQAILTKLLKERKAGRQPGVSP